MKIPTPWITMAVSWGEKNRHLYYDNDQPAITFHSTREEAGEEADRRALAAPGSHFVVFQAVDWLEVDMTVNKYPISSAPGPEHR